MRGLTAAALVLSLLLAACQPRAVAEDPVVGAVVRNDAAAVRDYLAGGGDPDLANREGDSLLYIAAGARGGIEVARLLIAAGASLEAGSADGRTALANAAGWCDVEMVRMLLAAGADAAKVPRNGKTLEESVCSAPVDRRGVVLALLRDGKAG